MTYWRLIPVLTGNSGALPAAALEITVNPRAYGEQFELA